jgi:SAM-dependent methyltransferase
MEAASFECSSCKRQFSAPDGIPCLAEHPSYDYGGISQQEMLELLENFKPMSWRQALEHIVHTSSYPLAFLEHAASPGRAGWWPLLNIQPSWRVLELGCEWGAITFSLAPIVTSVVACDLNLERLRFLKVRALEDGVSNVRLFCAGDTPWLPFADQEFHLVILNGILERAPVSKSGSPIAIQRALLREAARLLVPKGQLLLAARNRWSWQYWGGKPENHTHLRFISLLPRVVADLYAMKRIGKPYRAHTYSYWGYKHLLRSAGFASNKAFIPQPDFVTFHAIIDPSNRKNVELYFEERDDSPRFGAVGLKARSSLAPLLAASFCWIANRDGPQSSFLESLGEHVALTLYGEVSRQLQCAKFRVSRREVMTLDLAIRPGSLSVILKIPLSDSSNLRSNLEYKALSSLREYFVSSQMWPEIPKALLRGEFRRVPYFVQEALPGVPGVRFLHSGVRTNQVKQLALDFIVRLHLAKRTPVKLDEAAWDATVMPLLDPGLRSAERYAGVNAAYFRDYLMKELVGHTWPFVFSHGDYWPGNLLFDEAAQRVLGVIDWDRALPHSLPLVDLMNFLLSGRAEVENVRVTALIGKVLQEGLNREDSRLVDSYLQSMGFSLTFRQVRAFVLLDWLFRVSMWVSSPQSPWWCELQWIRDNLAPSATWLKDVLGLGRA